jgi:hypothetical protein
MRREEEKISEGNKEETIVVNHNMEKSSKKIKKESYNVEEEKATS